MTLRLSARLRTALALLADLALFALVVAYAAQTDAGRPFTFEHDIYHLRGEACLRHGECPMTGSVLQGPGYVYLLALCRLFTADPSLEYGLTLALLGLAAVLSARLIHARYGWPWGWLAAVITASDLHLLRAYRDGQHAPFITLPLAVLGWATVQWVNGRGGRFLVYATAAAAVALHFHGIAVVALPGLVLAGALYRPATSRRALAAAVLAPLLIQAPTVFDALRTRALPGSLHSVSSIHHFLRVQYNGQNINDLSVPGVAITAAVLVLAAAALGPSPLRYEPRSAATLLLFFAGPCVTYLATRDRYNWYSRYLLVFEPSLGLLLAAAFGTLTGWSAIARRRGPALRAAAVWACLLLPAAWVARSTLQRTARSHDELVTQGEKLTYREQTAIAGSLVAHGIPPSRWLEAMHGASWWSESVGPRSIGEMFAGASGATTGRPQALLVDHCARLPRGFATWQRPIAGAYGRLLAGYDPRLEPLGMTLSFPDGSVWSAPRFTRFLPGACGFGSEILTRVSPPQRAGTAGTSFNDLWMNATAGVLRLRGVLRPGAGDRVLAVQHGSLCQIEVRIGGVVRATQGAPTAALAGAPPLAAGSHVTDRFLIPAGEHAAGPVDFELTVDRSTSPGQARFDHLRFFELDVFEEPWPACEAPQARSSSQRTSSS